MVVSSVDIKKNMITTIIEFQSKLDFYINEYNVTAKQASEMLGIAKEINKLIDSLNYAGDISDLGIKAPRIEVSEYNKLERVLELTFRYKTDLNAVSMDIGEKLSYSNQLLQAGVDYIFINITNKKIAKANLEDYTNKNKEVKKTVKKRVQSKTVNKAPVKKKSSSFSKLLFFVILIGGGYAVYNSIFNQHANQVSSLVKEYRADEKLSEKARPVITKYIKIKGSPSIVGPIKKWQNNFLSKYEDLKLDIGMEDSGFAISKLIDGEITIAASSRMPTIKERKKSQKLGRLIADHKVAMDAVAVFVHPSNPIGHLSVEDLKAIYGTESVSWWVYGGDDSKLDKYSPSPKSGTYNFFNDRVMFHEALAKDVVKLYDIEQMIEMIENNPSGIGFASLSNVLGRDVKILALTTYFNKDKGVSPIAENNLINSLSIKRGEYPLTRYLYLLTAGELDDSSAKFIDFFRSNEGQSVLGSSGLVSIY